MIRGGGLWKNKDKNGNTYLSGNLGGLRVLIFPNTRKEKDNHPDYTLCFDENKPRDRGGVTEEDVREAFGSEGEDDIPF